MKTRRTRAKPVSIANSKLRRCLQKITGGTPVYRQEQAIAELASTCPHSIQRIRDTQTQKWNCFAYAFALVASETYQRIAWADKDAYETFFANSAFVQFIMQSGALIEVGDDEASPGDIVIYLDDDDTPQHAGKIFSKDRRIRSKWGFGLFWEHGLWEVPERFGDKISFYREVPTAEAERIFLDFVKSLDGWEEFVDKELK